MWADQVVEESNLTSQTSALPQALGQKKDEHRFNVPVPVHGFGFVAALEDFAWSSDAVGASAA